MDKTKTKRDAADIHFIKHKDGSVTIKSPSHEAIFKLGDKGLSLKIMPVLSMHYIQSAAMFSRLCAEIEKKYREGSLQDEEAFDLIMAYKSYAISSIFAACAFLEGTINKFFADMMEYFEYTLDELFANVKSLASPNEFPPMFDSSETKLMMLDTLKSGIAGKDNGPVYEKFDRILESMGKEGFDKGASPYQDVTLLINLRNALTHYKPQWMTTLSMSAQAGQEVDNKKLETLRKQKKFSLNPFYEKTNNSFFPDKCLSYGCAKWATESSLKFCEEFVTKTGWYYPMNRIQSRLKTES